MRTYRTTFDFVETEEQAKQLCERINKAYTYYMRKNHPAHFTPWKDAEGKSTYNYVVWYQV